MQQTDSVGITSKESLMLEESLSQEISDEEISRDSLNSDSDQSSTNTKKKSNQNTQNNVLNLAQQYTSARIKYFPWRSWQEWSLLKSKIDIICDPKIFNTTQYHKKTKLISEVIKQVSLWESKNTQLISSAQNASPHTKYLKMQKILMKEKLCQEKLAKELETQTPIDLSKSTSSLLADAQLGSNMRLIQLVEMGASSNKYRKSKQGGKLAMKNVAEELNFPQSLVSLRHQAVHESRDGSSHSTQILAYAFRKLQKFIDQNYWIPLSVEFERREVSLSSIQRQVNNYQIVSAIGKQVPTLNQFEDLEERRKIASRFTKANCKIPKNLDPQQLSELIIQLVERSLAEINVSFKDYARLNQIVANYQTNDAEKEIGKLVITRMAKKSEFVCFLMSLERKFTPLTIQTLLFARILAIFNQEIYQKLNHEIQEEQIEHQTQCYDQKVHFETIFKLIALFSILRQIGDEISQNQQHPVDFNRIIQAQISNLKESDTYLPCLIRHLKAVYSSASFDLLSWYFRRCIQNQMATKSQQGGMTSQGKQLQALIKKAQNSESNVVQKIVPLGQKLLQTYTEHIMESEATNKDSTKGGQTENTNRNNQNLDSEHMINDTDNTVIPLDIVMQF